MSNVCKAFEMKDFKETLNHLKGLKFVESFEAECNGHDLYMYDEGRRVLLRCPECDALVLHQISIYHNYCSDPDDQYYDAYFSVGSREEVIELNEKYDGFQIYEAFKGPSILRG